MNKPSVNKIMIVLITIAAVLLYLLPYGIVFNPGSDIPDEVNGQSAYIFKDFELAIIYIPFGVFWVVFLILKRSLFKTIVKYIVLGTAFLYFLLAFEGLVMIAQDFVPAIGLVISGILFPLCVIFAVNDHRLIKGESKIVQI